MKWDAGPSVRWDMVPPIYWDRPVFPINLKGSEMQPFKVVFDFIGLGEPRFGDKVRFIVTCLTTAPMTELLPDPIPAPFPARTALQTALTNYEATADAAKDSIAAKKIRKQNRAILEQLLKKFAPHVETTAEAANNYDILTKSGYTLRHPIVKPTSNGIPPAPLITAKRGKISGSVQVRVKPLLHGVGSYEGQFTVGEAAADGSFQPGVISKNGSRITFTDLEVAKLHHLRVRGIGSKGPGDWSEPYSIIVT